MTVRLIAAVIFLLVPGLSCLSADVYRWTDAQGNVFYGNQPPPGARDARVMFKEQSGPAAGQPAGGEAPSTEAVLQELEDDLRREAEARKDADSIKKNTVPNQAELVAREKVKLEKKIEELENAPLDQFGSQRNKRVRIGYYQYRLETLLSDPDGYFKTPEPFEGNIPKTEKP